MKKITISDKTLCAAGAKEGRTLTFRERMSIAARLEAMGVDAIILPEMQRVKEETVMNRTLCAACKTASVKIIAGVTPEAIAAAWESVREAQSPALQIVLPVSTVQMEYLYHKKSTAMLETVKTLVAAAAALCPQVELVATDASRADAGFIAEVCAAAQESGATAVILSDDAGVWMPEDAATCVRTAAAACTLPIGVCPSDALHMAAAVTVAALRAGAAGVVTAAAEDEALSPDALADVLEAKGEELGITCGISFTEIHRDMTEMKHDVFPDGRPAADAEHRIRLTAESTLAEVASAAVMLGYELSEEDAGLVTAEVHRVTAQKGHVGSRDLEAIIATTAMQVPSTYHLDSFVCSSGNVMAPMAQITLTHGDEKLSGVSMGDGPIDAAFMAIEQIVGHHYELDDFQVQSVTEGRSAMGSALVKLRSAGKLYSGSGISTDIIGASIRAYLNALNKIVSEEA